jgi:phosphohistidine phosphatase SixA
MKHAAAVATALLITTAAGVPAAQTVVLVRHAEKAPGASADPPLSHAGVQRAQALAKVLEGAAPALIITSTLQRTVQTAAPSVGPGVALRRVPLEGGVEAHVGAVANEARRQASTDLILIVGHSNTVPAIAAELGSEATLMPDCEYDRLIVLQLAPGAATRALTARYGAPSEACGAAGR